MRLGVALGGGTARGLAHVGALKALDALGMAPAMVSGTSFGALIAGLYALGAHGVALEHLIRQQNTLEIWAQALDFGLHRASIIHGRRLCRWLDRKFFFGATFEDTEIPLAIACTDLVTGELVILREGSIAKAVRASCALPGYFAAVPRDGMILMDGGFIEPVPFSALRSLGPEHMLGIHAGINADRARTIRLARRFHRSRLGRLWQSFARRQSALTPWGQLVRGLMITLEGYEKPFTAPPDGTLVHVFPPVAWWDFHKSPQAIAAGERAVLEALSGAHAPWEGSRHD